MQAPAYSVARNGIVGSRHKLGEASFKSARIESA
jgi:hypothetical protein